MASGQDSRSALSVGMAWSARVTSIGLEFCVPAVLGRLADRGLGTSPWLTVVGAVVGMAIGMVHVVRLPQEIARAEARAATRTRPKSGEPGAPG